MSQRGLNNKSKALDEYEQLMVELKLPLTRDNYLNTIYPEDVPEITPEIEETLPERYRNKS